MPVRRLLILGVLLTALMCFTAADAMALGAGDLDPTFSGDGYATLAFGQVRETASVAAPAPDGKVVVGAFVSGETSDASALARLLPDGSLDPSFGSGGVRVLPEICPDYNQAADIDVLPDGKILAAGGCQGSFVVRRLNADGSDDETFGSGPGGHGRVLTSFAPRSADAWSMGVEAGTGAITLSGVCCTGEAPQYQDSTFARYTAGGQLDPGFDGPPGNPAGGNGKVIIPFNPTGDDRGADMAQLPGGGIAIVGDVSGDVFVAEVGSDGRPIESFSGDGFATIPDAGEYDTGWAIAADAAGGLIVGIDAADKAKFIRLDASGEIDKGFVPTVFDANPGYTSFPAGLAVAPDGTILAGVNVYLPWPNCNCGSTAAHTLVARLLPGGQPDPSFGPGGYRTLTGPEGGFSAEDLALDGSGSLLIPGRSFPFPVLGQYPEHATVARVLTAEPKPTPPSNAFKLGKLRRNKRRGTAKLTVLVSGPGAVAMAGSKKVKPASKAAKAAGAVILTIKPKGRARKKLARSARRGKVGRLKLKLAVSFTPSGGSTATQTKTLTLVRAPSKKKPNR